MVAAAIAGRLRPELRRAARDPALRRRQPRRHLSGDAGDGGRLPPGRTASALNRNPRNLGLIGHLNRVMTLVSGDFVVQNAGDDVSAPGPGGAARRRLGRRRPGAGRAFGGAPARRRRRRGADGAALGRRWPGSPPAEVIADSRPGRRRHLIGASMGWDRRLWDAFGPLPETALIEDRPIAFRAALEGRIAWLDAALVDYRPGGASDGEGAEPAAYRLARARWHRSYQRSLPRRPRAGRPGGRRGAAAAGGGRARPARLRDRPRRGRPRRPAGRDPPRRRPGARPPRAGAAARPAPGAAAPGA